PLGAETFARLATGLGRRCAEVIADVADSADLIAVHGQTIVHRPPISWQLIDPAPIAARFGCPVVSDLRQADLAAGGQGAPITPIADWLLFRDPRQSRAIVNLGGFCSLTLLPAGGDASSLAEVRAFDVCACNHLLDAVADQALGARYDEDGRAARSGRADDSAAAALLTMLESQRRGGRSLGTGDELTNWVSTYLGRLAPADLAATAVDSLARCIGECCSETGAEAVYVGGGGGHNHALAEALARFSRCPVGKTDQLGVPINAREALAMAALGALCADGVAISLPQVTGCRAPAPVAGVWCLPEGLPAGIGPRAPS
ncbi:MAG: anhydro-N-acetylmuramic acid kinase, partial [Planctomycetota bacterium]